jgi:hypothetical protein
MTTLTPVINPAAPSLPLSPGEFVPQYQDQFSNVLRLYFNQLNTGLGTVISNQNTIQAEIDAQQIEIDGLQSQVNRNQTLIWTSSGGGIFCG